MQLEIYKPSQSSPVEWNHEALKAAVSERMTAYKGIVYTEDQQAQAKADRATLNKLVGALDGFLRDERKKALEGFEETKKQVEEIKAIIIPCRDEIDAQDKKFTEFKKTEKRARILTELYNPMIGNLRDLVPYYRLHEAKWLNVTCSMNTVADALAKKIERISSGLASIDKLDLDEALTEQAKVIFLKDFDLAAAINATERILKQREALARLASSGKAQNDAEPEKKECGESNHQKQENGAEVSAQSDGAKEKIHTVEFRVHVTAAQLKALGDFMRENGIKPERI